MGTISKAQRKKNWEIRRAKAAERAKLLAAGKEVPLHLLTHAEQKLAKNGGESSEGKPGLNPNSEARIAKMRALVAFVESEKAKGADTNSACVSAKVHPSTYYGYVAKLKKVNGRKVNGHNGQAKNGEATPLAGFDLMPPAGAEIGSMSAALVPPRPERKAVVTKTGRPAPTGGSDQEKMARLQLAHEFMLTMNRILTGN